MPYILEKLMCMQIQHNRGSVFIMISYPGTVASLNKHDWTKENVEKTVETIRALDKRGYLMIEG